MGSNEIVTKQCSAVLKAAHSAANGTEKGLNFELLRDIYFAITIIALSILVVSAA